METELVPEETSDLVPELLPEIIYTCSSINPQGIADMLNSVKSKYGGITIHSILTTDGRIQDTLVKVFIAYYSIPAQQVVIEKVADDTKQSEKPTVIKKRMYLGQVDE